MSDDRKLKLVPRPKDGEADEPPPTPEERAEAEALRDALERDDEPISGALRALYRPKELETPEVDALLDRALEPSAAEVDEDDAAGIEGPMPADDEELEAARELREDLAQLEGPRGPRPAPVSTELGELAEMLRAAHDPAGIDELRNEALIAKALGRRATGGHGARRRGALGSIVGGVVAAAAVAAGLFAVQFSAQDEAPVQVGASAASLIQARSTTELFDAAEPFPRTGGTTARIDKIARSRAADLRQNRYVAWGVRE